MNRKSITITRLEIPYTLTLTSVSKIYLQFAISNIVSSNGTISHLSTEQIISMQHKNVYYLYLILEEVP